MDEAIGPQVEEPYSTIGLVTVLYVLTIASFCCLQEVPVRALYMLMVFLAFSAVFSDVGSM